MSCAAAASNIVRRDSMNEIGDSGLTRLSWMAATHVEDSLGLTIGDLAGRLEVGRATAGQLVDRMVQGGWVERWPSPDDRRSQIVTATPKARAMLEELAPRQSALEDEILQDLSADERRILLALLERIKSRLLR